MATLPADRTKLALAQSNQNPSNVLGSSQNKNALTEAYDTIDLLYGNMTGLISAAQLSKLGIINVMDYNASGSVQTTTGSITTGTNILTLASASDFKNGQGINVNGKTEVDSLQITAAATVSSNVTVTLNGVAFLVAVLAGDTIAQVASKIRSATYAGWTTGGATDTVTFTSTTTGTRTTPVYSAGTTTATGTMTVATLGSADLITTISSGAGTTILTLAASATTVAPGATVAHDDTVALQNAVNYVISKKNPLLIPNGTYNISSPITINGQISIIGQHRYQTQIKAVATMDSLLSITASIDSAIFQGFGLVGNQTNYGFNQASGAYISNTHFIDLSIVSTLISAMNFIDGWSNDILLCEIQSNKGNGITFTRGTTNIQAILNIENNKIYSNDGVGILLNGNLSKATIRKNQIESNKQCGLYLVGQVSGVSIKDNRFENNSTVGYTFATPAQTIKADIIVNGSNVLNTFSTAYPCKNISIEDNFTDGSPLHVYAVTGKTIRVINNCDNQGTATAVKITGDSSVGVVNDLVMQSNNNFSKILDVENIQANKQQNYGSFYLDTVPKRSYLTNNFLEYVTVAPNNGGTITKGDIQYNGFDTFVISGAASGYSTYYGLNLDMSLFPELAGKLVYVGVYAKCALGTGVAAPVIYIGGVGTSKNYYISNTSWNLEQMQAVLPTTGTVSIAFASLGNTNAGEKVYFANPVLSLVGYPYVEQFKTIQEPVYKAGAAPTTGNWEVGKRVINKPPTVGQPKAWVCTAAPATFTSEGNL